MIDPNDERLSINQAAKLIDPEWLGAIAALHTAERQVAQAERVLRDARATLAAVKRTMRLTHVYSIADNAIPGRSVPALIAAARRELGVTERQRDAWMDAKPRAQRSPRYRTRDGAPGRMCACGHREGSHNDLARCCAGECLCGNSSNPYHEWFGGFDPVDERKDGGTT